MILYAFRKIFSCLHPKKYPLQTMNSLQWYVAYTFSRSEKKINTRIQQLGIQSFLPLKKVKRKWSDRLKIVEVPLFPSYVFVNTIESKISKLKSIDGIATFLSFGNKLATVKQDEIDLIRKVVQCEVNVEVVTKKFTEGQKVKIQRGPFAGLRGTLIKEQSKRRFIVELNNLNHHLLIDIPAYYL